MQEFFRAFAEPTAGIGVPDRLRSSGDDRSVGGPRADAVIFALRELVTNSVKYGALGPKGGHVEAAWSDGPSGGSLLVSWVERCDESIVATTGSNRGMILLLEDLPEFFGARTMPEWAASGIRFEMRFSRETHLVSSQATKAKALVLLAEDNEMVLAGIATMMSAAGYDVRTTTTTEGGLAFLALGKQPEIAILDGKLLDGDSIPLAVALRRKSIPTIFVYGNGPPPGMGPIPQGRASAR